MFSRRRLPRRCGAGHRGQRRVVPGIGVRHARLGGQEDLVALALQQRGQQFLGHAADIGVGGIDVP